MRVQKFPKQLAGLDLSAKTKTNSEIWRGINCEKNYEVIGVETYLDKFFSICIIKFQRPPEDDLR